MPKNLKSSNADVVRVQRSILVDADTIGYDGFNQYGRLHDGFMVGGPVKVTALTDGTARNYGFRNGTDAYSLKVKGYWVRYVTGSTVIWVNGKKWTVRKFYAAHRQ